MSWAIIAAALLVGLANGANDNFKGVATIFGSATASYRTALAWATVTTLAGSALALVLAGGLVDTFSGAGLVPDATAESGRFLTAVGIGAGATVVLASAVGLPISTTHALVGALVGAGLAAVPGAVELSVLGAKFLLPLILGPLLAIVLAGTLYPLAGLGRRALGVKREACVCVGSEWVPVQPAAGGTLTIATALPVAATGHRLTLAAGTTNSCRERYRGKVLGASVQHEIDAIHFLSAGAVSFARGVNDTPKIAALLIGAGAVGAEVSIWTIAIAIALGGVLGARRVAETMSHRITSLTPGQGLVSNLSAAFLVTVASRYGLPVSTTHVTNGGLFAIGAETGDAHWDTIGKILLAWVTTLPIAAAL
ncbi:MAG: inorganic phosphate transporter, partial [Acidimicrobiia bacterium]